MKKFYLSGLVFPLCVVYVTYGQWTNTNLSAPKAYLGATSLGSKAYFAGGMNNSGLKSTVEIWDALTGEWDTTQHLSVARDLLTATTCGEFVFFAGGLYDWAPSATVDVFNYLSLWEVHELSVPRFALSAAAKDDQVLFAGGGSFTEVYDVVDIYNLTTQEWHVEHLTIPRTSMGCAVAGDLVFFAGGSNAENTEVYNRIDIYNFTTGTWDTASLSQARSFPGATVAQDKVIFAGGSLSNGVPSDMVDILDIQTGEWETATLSVARGFYSQSATVCGIAYFVGSGIFDGGWGYGTDTVDVYDPEENTWSIITLPEAVTENAVVAIDSTLFSAGGFSPLFTAFNTVEMYTNCVYGHVPSIKPGIDLTAYPNPFTQSTTFSYSLKEPGHITLQIFDSFGRLVDEPVQGYQEKGEQQVFWDAETLPAGIYFFRIQAVNEVGSGKIIKW